MHCISIIIEYLRGESSIHVYTLSSFSCKQFHFCHHFLSLGFNLGTFDHFVDKLENKKSFFDVFSSVIGYWVDLFAVITSIALFRWMGPVGPIVDPPCLEKSPKRFRLFVNSIRWTSYNLHATLYTVLDVCVC